jgi:hypothetical protein
MYINFTSAKLILFNEIQIHFKAYARVNVFVQVTD